MVTLLAVRLYVKKQTSNEPEGSVSVLSFLFSLLLLRHRKLFIHSLETISLGMMMMMLLLEKNVVKFKINSFEDVHVKLINIFY